MVVASTFCVTFLGRILAMPESTLSCLLARGAWPFKLLQLLAMLEYPGLLQLFHHVLHLSSAAGLTALHCGLPFFVFLIQMKQLRQLVISDILHGHLVLEYLRMLLKLIVFHLYFYQLLFGFLELVVELC